MYSFLRPILFSLEAERAHHLATRTIRVLQRCEPLWRLFQAHYSIELPSLSTSAFGIEFSNPIGIAAGFDKNGTLVDAIAGLGFGFLEVGSVTNEARAGNPSPRLFRLPEDQALINRLGLNNHGPEELVGTLAAQRLTIPFGVNIAKTNDSAIVGDRAVNDIVACFSLVAGAGNFTVLNLSCPNTEDGRPFEEPSALWLLLHAVMAKRTELGLEVPVLVKFSPDLPDHDFEQAIEICEGLGVTGYVLTNTTKSREGLVTSPETIDHIGNGGLSGRPLTERVRARVATTYRLVGAGKPIIGCGGVFTGEDAYRLIRAGATLVELYTGLVYQGPRTCRMIAEELDRLLRRDGFTRIGEVVGLDAS